MADTGAIKPAAQAPWRNERQLVQCAGGIGRLRLLFDYIAQFDVGSAAERIGGIVEAVQILATSPMIGRPFKGGKRELVIGRATRGYVALYKYVAPLDTVFVLAMRSQRESGCKNNS